MYQRRDRGVDGGDGGDFDYPPMRYKPPPESEYGPVRGPGGAPPLQLRDWLFMAGLLFVLALAAVALGLSIWATERSGNNSRRIDDLEDDGGGMMKRTARGAPMGPPFSTGRKQREAQEYQHGQTFWWDAKQKGWVVGHGRLGDMEDVSLGSKQRPLEDGDLLQWRQGQVVNARDRVLEQELGHHLDTQFRNLATGHIIIRNQTAAQWRNVPLSALFMLSSLGDVDLGPFAEATSPSSSSSTKKRRVSDKTIPDQSMFLYDSKTHKWTARAPRARAWLRFCPGPEKDPQEAWGRIDPALQPERWSSVRPVSPVAGVYMTDMQSRGGLFVSREKASITTPRASYTSRPGFGRPYRLRATVSAINMPPGAWGFLVGSEAAPSDGGFLADTDNNNNNQNSVGHWQFETVRDIQDDQRIVIGYRISNTTSSDTNRNIPLIQCMFFNVEEL
jgi:hypothetical protein